jgi:hypothetical protein
MLIEAGYFIIAHNNHVNLMIKGMQEYGAARI